jgi:hypothetical protein
MAYTIIRLIAFITLSALITFALFYNLGQNPRPWADEGAMLSLARTITQDGVYATQTASGYETYGAVQSVGPTVILPMSASMRMFGIGFVQGRAVVALYGMLALLLLFACARQLGLSELAALCAIAIFVPAAGSYFLAWSRQALGEVPALAFWLLAWWLWARQRQHSWLWAGLSLGAALITKSQYLIFGVGIFVLLAGLDLAYYRQRQALRLTLVCGVALLCYAAWVVWQVWYFGWETYAANLDTLSQLGRVTTRPNTPAQIADGLRSVLGRDMEGYYLLWGIPACAFGVLRAAPRSIAALRYASLVVFGLMWLVYAIGFYHIVWPPLLIAPGAVVALLIARLAQEAWQGLHNLSRQQLFAMPHMASLALLLVLGLWATDQWQSALRFDVVDKTGREGRFPRAPQLANAQSIAQLIAQHAPANSVIETWDRELAILTSHRYHYPPQALLIQTQQARETGSTAHSLGEKYFANNPARYLVVGAAGRDHRVYQENFLTQRCNLIGSVGEGRWRYELYGLP